MKFTFGFIGTLAALSLAQASAIDFRTAEESADRLARRGGTPLSQSEAASRLSAAGISSSSSGGCTDKNTPTCTSYSGLLSGTVDNAITLKKACGCDLVITGGTETGHAGGQYSHGNGYKLDFKKTGGLNSYVTGTFKKIGNRGDGYPQWQSAAGNIYCDEGNHWDVTYF